MRWSRLAGWLLLAVVVGLAVGAATASKPPSGPGRPVPVEDVLRALDSGSRTALAAKLSAAGRVESYPSPWRDELAVAAAVSRQDPDALWRIGTGKPGAAAARALLWLSENGASVEVRARALDRLRADYPSSWALEAKSGGVPQGPR